MNHERIHLKQQLETLVIPFYIMYATEYVIARLKGRNHHGAYRHISFEQEAYGNEHELTYLKTRKFWAFFKYVGK